MFSLFIAVNIVFYADYSVLQIIGSITGSVNIISSTAKNRPVNKENEVRQELL